MLLCLTDSSPEVEQACVQMIRQNKADGIIALTYRPELEIDGDLPFVSFDRQYGSNVPCVSSDNYGGGQLAAEKLLELGCKHLAFFHTGSSQHSEPDKRCGGFEQVCRFRGVAYDKLRINGGEQSTEVFHDFLRDRMAGGKLDIDGILCSTDILAMHVKGYLEDLGLRVPEDVQIIGFDGIRRLSDDGYYCSTIVQPVDKLAETCVDLLLSKNTGSTPSLVCLPVTYAPGGTTRE